MGKPARRPVPLPALDSTPPSLRSRDLFMWVASLGRPIDVYRTVPLKNAYLTLHGGWTKLPEGERPRTHFMNWGGGARGRSVQSIAALPFGAYRGKKSSQVLRRSVIDEDTYYVDPCYEAPIMALVEAFSAGAFWSDASESPANTKSR
jgi:hypothetical protein